MIVMRVDERVPSIGFANFPHHLVRAIQIEHTAESLSVPQETPDARLSELLAQYVDDDSGDEEHVSDDGDGDHDDGAGDGDDDHDVGKAMRSDEMKTLLVQDLDALPDEEAGSSEGDGDAMDAAESSSEEAPGEKDTTHKDAPPEQGDVEGIFCAMDSGTATAPVWRGGFTSDVDFDRLPQVHGVRLQRHKSPERWQAWYPGASPHESHSVRFGPCTGLTDSDALNAVILWLWSKHPGEDLN